MKSVFGVEAIGVQPAAARRMRAVGMLNQARRDAEPWLMELLGITEMGSLIAGPRLRPNRDYRLSNSAGSRGTWWWWTLEAGHLYETRYRTTWTTWHHEYLAVTGEGDVVTMQEGEVAACLRSATWG